MSELKALIAGLIRGKRSFEDVSRALDRLLAREPRRAPEAARLLHAARESGLPHHLFVALNGQIGAIVNASPDPDATRFAAGDERDVTVMPGDDPHATVFAGDGDDATSMAASAAGHGADVTSMTATGRTARGRAAADDDRTSVPGSGPGEATGDFFDPLSGEVTAGGAADDTTAMGAAVGDDHTIMGADDDGFDILSDDALEAAERASGPRTGASWPTAPPRASGTVAGVDREFHEGDLLRGRFELISKLGEGGMGAVWKGKDKLKEEARDRNPFVAIKLLQGDFKAHPEAFIALQRETAKQQRLAHPNIATVYDFDRDDATSTVFMTMEVLEGQPLDAYIRKLPADGLSEEEAMPLIEQLSSGLSYAHQAGLVHSDLKPGNCFLTKEGAIKLLDFGIARASKTKSDAEGETTLFDPGQLGALTPTYATIEMFEGEDPDPRDDIYALAIMAYQLLTGRHPYGKKSALKAKELGLSPDPVAKLTKRQNRGLARGLAFHREERTPTVEEFLESITRRQSRTALWAAGIAAVLALAVAGAWGPVKTYLETQDREAVVAVIQQGGPAAIEQGLGQARLLGDEQLTRVLDDPRTIDTVAAYIASGDENVQAGLGLLRRYPPAWQQQVKQVDAARNAIFDYYERRISRAFSPQEQRYDYPAALSELAALDAHYPDSARVFQLRATLEDIKRETLADMGTRYKELLAAGALIPDDTREDISDVLSVVEAIDSGHFLLQDRNLPFRFVEETQKAIEQDRDYRRAGALLAASAAYAPDDPKLKGLRYDLDRILTRIENEKRIAELEGRLRQAEPGLTSLAGYQGVRDDLVALAEINPHSAVLARIRERLKSAFDEELARLTTAGEWQRSEALLFDFARLLGITDLTRQRIALSEAEKAAGFTPDLAARKAQVDERVATVEALLASPEFTVDWETRLKVPYKELIALQPLGSPELEKVRESTARLLLGAAREARGQENFNQARELVARGLEFYPGLKNFADESAAIDRDEQAFLARRAEAERLAKVETLKSEFTETAQANDVEAAKAKLADIRALGVAGDDPFLEQTAPDLLSMAYHRLATQAAGNDDYLNAAAFAEEGLKLNPQLQALADALESYRTEIRKREREIRLAALFNSLDPIDVAATRQALAALQADVPDRYGALEARFSAARAEQLRRYARTRDVDVAVLAARAGEYARVFPQPGAALGGDLADSVEPRLRRVDVTSARQLEAFAGPLAAFGELAPARHAALVRELAERALGAIRDLERTDKAAAAALARAARAAFPGNREIAALDIVVPLDELTAGLAQLERGQLEAAGQSLAAARRKAPGHPDIAPFEARLADHLSKARSAYAKHVALADDPVEGNKRRREVRDLFKDAVALCRDCGFQEKDPQKLPAGYCHPGLAGFGTRRAGQCWDRIGRDKGPMMVVVPPGGGNRNAFAIGKYEVSGRDFNAFCKETGKCKVILGSRSRLPATDVPAELAEQYAQWLSEEASRSLDQKVVYRLPTAAEWAYAAAADGAQPERKFNCRVTSGGNIIAGHDLVDARSGQENGWGLANYVGNAQELVRNGAGFEVRGGDFEVPLTRCDVNVSEPHNGAAGPTTGFRLVRELG